MLTTSPRPAPRLTAGVAQTIALLALPQAGLIQRLAVEAADNPALRLMPPKAPGWLSPVLDPAGLTAPGDSLIGHVLHQIGGMDLLPRDRAIALALTEALEPTGWLGTPPARIARTCGLAEEAVLAVLARLQRMEPGGLFARSLAECLRLQAEQAGEMTPALAAVLADLPLLAGGGVAALAAKTGRPEPEIHAAAGRLRAYDPKPGLAFADHSPPAPPADLLLRCTAGSWEAVVNPHTFSLGIDAGHPGQPRAEALRQALEGRQRIAVSIGTALARRQSGWLDGGAMAAVTARDVAADTGFHVSTVNRCLAAVTARMPFGTRPLRALVSHPVGAGGTSGEELRSRLRALLAAAGDGPVSDAALTAQLEKEGIRAARRTVAKYRAALAPHDRQRAARRPG